MVVLGVGGFAFLSLRLRQRVCVCDRKRRCTTVACVHVYSFRLVFNSFTTIPVRILSAILYHRVLYSATFFPTPFHLLAFFLRIFRRFISQIDIVYTLLLRFFSATCTNVIHFNCYAKYSRNLERERETEWKGEKDTETKYLAATATAAAAQKSLKLQKWLCGRRSQRWLCACIICSMFQCLCLSLLFSRPNNNKNTAAQTHISVLFEYRWLIIPGRLFVCMHTHRQCRTTANKANNK